MFNINIEGDVYDNEINQVQGDLVISEKEEKNISEILYDSLIALQARKYLLNGEDEKNEILSDLLRQKGLSISDETRQGRSGSQNETNYKSGELDIGIRHPKTGNIISIIEALELDSCGPKNKVIKRHIDKLIWQYDTAGNENNYIVVYSTAQNFSDLWANYKEYVEQVVFEKKAKFEVLKRRKFQKVRIRVGETIYKTNDFDQKLTHFFVDMSTT